MQQPQEPVIVDLLREKYDHHIMIEFPETVGDISLDEPGRSGPGVGHLTQSGVASPARPVPVGVVGELRLIERRQEQAHYFADQFV